MTAGEFVTYLRSVSHDGIHSRGQSQESPRIRRLAIEFFGSWDEALIAADLIRGKKWAGYVRPSCALPSCRQPQHAHGYCGRHLQRLRQHGQLERTSDLLFEVYLRFWKYVLLDDVLIHDGCWLWRGGTSNGYGLLHLSKNGRKTSVRAHRFAYEAMIGPIPKGLQLDHLCRVRSCVNPKHLEPVTNAENVRRGVIARRDSGQTPKSLSKLAIGEVVCASP